MPANAEYPTMSFWRRKRPAPRSKQDYVDFWIRNAMQDITPPGTEHPAGWDEVDFIGRVCGMLPYNTVCEFGCGYGRLCAAFGPGSYTGLDVNPKAIERAGAEHPEYNFRTIAYDDPLPECDLCLAYTVLLHVADEYVGEVVSRIRAGARQVVVAEILGRHWRRPSRVPVFNREKEEYVDLFSGYGLEIELARPYRRYPDTMITFLYFHR
ncbi:class I SAM-dependent methyltransferase [Verrucomicrobiota bacterium]